MADLTTQKRKTLPASDFGMPGERKYPMPDPGHAANAKARATQGVAKGTLSPSVAAKIRAKANKILNRGKTPSDNDGDEGTKKRKGRSAPLGMNDNDGDERR